MFEFDEDKYQVALQKIGLDEKELYPYRELILSEIHYLNHFLYVLNDTKINEILSVYDHKNFQSSPKETSQEEIRHIYNSLKILRNSQKELLMALYNPDPQQWKALLDNLKNLYAQYFGLCHHLFIPFQVDNKFKELEEENAQKGLPKAGSLSAVLIAPIQRFPRYILLGTSIVKHIEHEAVRASELENFRLAMLDFIATVNDLTLFLNTTILNLEKDTARKIVAQTNFDADNQLSVGIHLLDKLQALELEEIKTIFNKLDFSHTTKRQVNQLEAEHIYGNKKIVYFIEDKIVSDKIISATKALAEKYSKHEKDAAKKQIYLRIVECLYLQRSIESRCNIIQAISATYHKYYLPYFNTNAFLEFFSIELLQKINAIYNEFDYPPISIELLAIVIESEALNNNTTIFSEENEDQEDDDDEPSSPYFSPSAKLHRQSNLLIKRSDSQSDFSKSPKYKRKM